ncbi:MAG TPA: hypothetical protein VFZ80_05350, partial [Acidimicrobiia bacterium]
EAARSATIGDTALVSCLTAVLREGEADAGPKWPDGTEAARQEPRPPGRMNAVMFTKGRRT